MNPRRLPSTTGRCPTNARSPMNMAPVSRSRTVRSLSVCAVGHARSSSTRPPRSTSSVAATACVGSTIRLAVGALSERALQRGNVVRSAPAQRIGEPLMTDDLRMIVVERRIAEHVIRMHVRVDDEAHRQGRERADRRAQRAPDDIAAAGVDYSDAARADDEAHIGNVAIVVAGDVGQLAVMNVDARCRILEREVGQLGGFGGDGARPRDRRIRQGKREATQGTLNAWPRNRSPPGRFRAPSRT